MGFGSGATLDFPCRGIETTVFNIMNQLQDIQQAVDRLQTTAVIQGESYIDMSDPCADENSVAIWGPLDAGLYSIFQDFDGCDCDF